MTLRIGEKAPDFRLQNQKGEWIQLSQVLQTHRVILSFYPKDFTSICTQQLCDLGSAYAKISALGWRVLGISADSVASHQQFQAAQALPFDLLTDENKRVAKAFGMRSPWLLGMVSRGTCLIDQKQQLLWRQVEATPLTRPTLSTLLPVIERLS